MKPSRSDLVTARDEFIELINTGAPERSFQELFSRCPYIISESLPVRISPIDIVPMGTPGKSEPDFIFYPRSSDSIGEFGVIEIKRPDSKIATITRKNIATLSRDAETAISQCQHFLHNMDLRTIANPKDSIILGDKGHIFVIMGLGEHIYKSLLDDLRRQQLERRIPANCRLLPYDTVLNNFSKRIGAKIHVFVPALQKSHRIAIMDGSLRIGIEAFSEILSSLFSHLLGPRLQITIDDHMKPFTERFIRGECDIPVIILNPFIKEISEFWPLIRAGNAYEYTPFLFIPNPMPGDSNGVERLKLYFRNGFDSKIRMPFRVTDIAETLTHITKKLSEYRTGQSLIENHK
jgi:hypothetical protein